LRHANLIKRVLLPYIAASAALVAQPCGEVLDTYKDVPAKFNGLDTRQSCDGEGAYGWQYQCVEYVRRFYSQALGVNATTDNWKGDAKHYADVPARRGLVFYKNGGMIAPAPDDILVFDGPTVYGHVGIVTDVSSTEVELIEQNWDPSGKKKLTAAASGGVYSISRRFARGGVPVASASNPPAQSKPKPQAMSTPAVTKALIAVLFLFVISEF